MGTYELDGVDSRGLCLYNDQSTSEFVHKLNRYESKFLGDPLRSQAFHPWALRIRLSQSPEFPDCRFVCLGRAAAGDITERCGPQVFNVVDKLEVLPGARDFLEWLKPTVGRGMGDTAQYADTRSRSQVRLQLRLAARRLDQVVVP